MSRDEDGFYAPKPEVKKDLPKQLVTADVHPATIVQFIDLGWHKNLEYPDAKSARKVRVTVEIVDEMDSREDSPSKGKPLMLGSTFTFSTHVKSGLVTKLMSKIFNPALSNDQIEGYNFKELLGKNVSVTVAQKNSVKTGEAYAYISGFSPAHKRDTFPASPVHDLVFYDTQKHNKEVYEKLPEWVRKEIDADEKKINVDDASSY